MVEKSFLQSDDWGRFQEAVGHTVLKHNGYQFFETSVPFGKYLYCPHPTITSAEQFLEESATLTRKQNAWFVRVEPNGDSARITNYEAGSTGANIVPTLSLQPAHTFHVALADTETMLAAMHQKTRYNIRVAEKNGVTITFSQSADAASALINLLKQTADRAEIRLHPAAYYQKMLKLLGGTNPAENELRVEVALAEHDGVNIAGALLGWWGNTVIYMHGGSNYDRRALKAPNLLQWTAMQRARDAGKTTYDMGGVSPEETEEESRKNEAGEITNQAPHPWEGISRFKRGFGGKTIAYPPAVDIVYNNSAYQLYGMARKFRRSIR